MPVLAGWHYVVTCFSIFARMLGGSFGLDALVGLGSTAVSDRGMWTVTRNFDGSRTSLHMNC